MALECTPTERATLAAAIKAGYLRVAYADKIVQYQDAATMRSTLAEMDEYLAGSSAPSRHSRASFRRD